MYNFELNLAGESETLRLGKLLANACQPGDVIYLHGELGAGKTTLVRGFMWGKGHVGTVKSPTYTLVEHYTLAQQSVYHFDLYRLGDPSELEYMGIRDYFQGSAICLIEWAEYGAGYLPDADAEIKILHVDAGHRQVQFTANSSRGKQICLSLEESFGLYTASEAK